VNFQAEMQSWPHVPSYFLSMFLSCLHAVRRSSQTLA